MLMADGLPLQLTIDLHYTITPNKILHIEECTYTHGRWTPLQLAIDLCYIITPMKFHILKNAHIPMADGQPPIKHRSMEYHSTQ